MCIVLETTKVWFCFLHRHRYIATQISVVYFFPVSRTNYLGEIIELCTFLIMLLQDLSKPKWARRNTAYIWLQSCLSLWCCGYRRSFLSWRSSGFESRVSWRDMLFHASTIFSTNVHYHFINCQNLCIFYSSMMTSKCLASARNQTWKLFTVVWWHKSVCITRESNLKLQLRKLLWYPLHHRD